MAAKVVFLDIETSPSLGFVWGKYEQDVIEFERDWYIMSYAAKWQNGSFEVNSLQDMKGYSHNIRNDEKLVKKLWDILDKADIVIAHNGDKFDLRKINARFAFYRLNPPSPYKTIDTLKIARKYFKFDSNRLDDIGRYLGIGRKLQHTGFSLWKGCMEGDGSSWKLMKKYNKQDVILLEKVYEEFKRWVINHPITNELGNCQNCGGNLQARGFNLSLAGRKQRYQCIGCGAWSQGKLIK
jgi:DNA polymerase elongation subunit (family B)